MGLTEIARSAELDLERLKEVVRRDFETRLRNQTGKERLRVEGLTEYGWKMDSPFMKITLRSSVLGYIFPFQKTAYLFRNTANDLIEPVSIEFSNSGYKLHVKDMWQEAYSIVQHKEPFKLQDNLVLSC